MQEESESWVTREQELRAEIEVRSRLQPLRDHLVEAASRPQQVRESLGDVRLAHGPAVTRPIDFYETVSLESWATPDTATNRKDGHYGPVFRSESELSLFRGIARALADGDETAVGVLGNLVHYVVHTGFTYAVNATEKSASVDLLRDEARRCMEEFLAHNEWELSFEEELVKDSIVDGELLIALEAEQGSVRARHVEPAWLTQPVDPRLLEEELRRRLRISHAIDWRYGVATRQGDATEVYGYFVRWNGDAEQWNFYPPSRFLHLKRNVPRHVKRGLTDFYPVSGRIAGATELLSRMGTGAGIQASIALIIKNSTSGPSGGSIESLTGGSAFAADNPPFATSNWRNGEVIDTFGREFQAGPMGGQQAAGFVRILQAMRRATGVRWSMPEHMISGDASNNNYASILEAGAPFTRAIESAQQKYITAFETLLWRVLRIYFEMGRFNKHGFAWRQIRKLLAMTIEATSPAVRDKEKELRVAQSLREAGVLSRRTMASRFDLDLDEERRNDANESVE
ncbi:phage portal protein [Blastopirellula sp. JC732]|uniref:Phage portal protein n=1 Tax=Blastopirellula sediminis TaxID=2894196 RepID=A0A9X1MLB5_9BACT|nr:phage portal protein [Blastopirellula sediminis]MCC9608527.1 phage portal protein [Blastopirellula sediminis]MCC9628696.1 phage portal protein [Blastopirellula sediminis]